MGHRLFRNARSWSSGRNRPVPGFVSGSSFSRVRSFRVETGMQVHLGGLDLFVTQPERDHGAIYPVVKQVHGGGMAKRVRGDSLAMQRGTPCRRRGHVLRQQVLHPIGAEGPPRALGNSGSDGLP